MESRLRLPVVVICALLITSLASPSPLIAQDASDTWPTQEWRTSSPEAQGIDSEWLANMLTYIEVQDIDIHGIVIVRHGYLVTEAYRYPYEPDTLHSIQSCTKSIVSALVGIAFQQGHIEGVDQHVVDFFPQQFTTQLDDMKRAITLEHLLTMQSGLMMPEAVPEAVWQNNKFVRAFLDLPLAGEPGTHFMYNNMATQLLAEIVAETSDMSVPGFATSNLFGPLGIQNYVWDTMGVGLTNASAGLWLTPRDMAKIGYLYLRNGQWDDAQIVSQEWITASTTSHVTNPGIGSQRKADGYGYQWWINSEGYFMASGAGGQAILVQPDLDLVAVITSELHYNDIRIPAELFESFIIPAAQSHLPLPENPDKLAELETRVQTFAQPKPVPVPPMPTTATRISDQRYSLEESDFLWSSLILRFEQGAPEATIVLNDEVWLVGLDEVFRINDDRYLLRGQWIRENTFEIEFETLGYPFPIQILLRFDDATVSVRAWYHGFAESTRVFMGVVEE